MLERFSIGQLGITPGAMEALSEEAVLEAVRRHVQGDWGEVCEEDAHQNDWALKNDARLISVYLYENDVKFWIITEADRSSTTILLPSEY